MDLLNNPIVAGAGASLGIGVIFLALFARGLLPTPTERANLITQHEAERTLFQDQLTASRAIFEKQIADLQKAHELELTLVRTNLRDDLTHAREQILERDKYLKDLVQDIFEQQRSVSSDVMPPLAQLAQQLPAVTFLLQELQRRRDPNA